MPGVATQSAQLQVGDDGAHAEGLAGEANIEHIAHEAAPSIRADEKVRVNRALTCHVFDTGGNAFGVLRKAHELRTIFDPMAQFGETAAHHAFGQKLGHHERDVVRFSGRGIGFPDHIGVVEAADGAVFTLGRITAKGRETTNAIDKARDRILTAMLADWNPKDIATLAPLLRQLADRALTPES
jgi:hypothetical protein